jgi:hypothetical protein
MPDNQESPSKELDARKEENLSNKCEFCEKPHDNWVGAKGMLCQECWEKESDGRWWSALAANRIKSLEKQLTETQQALDEADRRAGAAERELSRCIKELCSVDACRRKYKERAGYSQNTSFDLVWEEVLEKSKQAQALDSAVVALEECAEDLKAELDARYCINDGELHPAIKGRYERDMGAVYRAEAALVTEESPRTNTTNVERVTKFIFKKIAHGDGEHRAWLEKELHSAVKAALASIRKESCDAI